MRIISPTNKKQLKGGTIISLIIELFKISCSFLYLIQRKKGSLWTIFGKPLKLLADQAGNSDANTPDLLP